MRLRKGMTWTPSKPSFVVTSDIRCSIGLYNFIFLRNRIKILSPHRSSCPEVFCKKSVLKNFAKFWEITKNTFFYRTSSVAASVPNISNENTVYVVRCAFWYHLYNFKKREKHPWKTVNFSNVAALPWVFFTFLNCTSGTKLRNASYINVKTIFAVSRKKKLHFHWKSGKKEIIFRLKTFEK